MRLLLFFVNSVLTAKRAELFDLESLGVQLFVLVGSVITLAARRAFELDELSHWIPALFLKQSLYEQNKPFETISRQVYIVPKVLSTIFFIDFRLTGKTDFIPESPK
jgi:hypothetical protein